MTNVAEMYESYCAKIWEDLNQQADPMPAEEDERDSALWSESVNALRDAWHKACSTLKELNFAAERAEGTTAEPRISSICDAMEKLTDEIQDQIRRMTE